MSGRSERQTRRVRSPSYSTRTTSICGGVFASFSPGVCAADAPRTPFVSAAAAISDLTFSSISALLRLA